jgi:hypothetical protein
MTKQVTPRQTIRFRSSAFDFHATVKRLSPRWDAEGFFANDAMYLDRQGDHIRFIRLLLLKKKLGAAAPNVFDPG